MELIKSLLKVVLVLSTGIAVYCLFFKKIVFINSLEVKIGMGYSVEILVYAFLILTSSLIIIALFDVPYQMWNYRQQLMMTRQELKDEYKETEGKPEVKAKIHRVRRELAKRRMMSAVPKADVIITNPTHFAVALKYDQGNMKAPVVVAKGADLVAQKIIDIGSQHAIPTVSMPPLARSIFFHTDIGEEIPQKLYMAVAQILAYVHQLKMYRRGKIKRPKPPKDVEIPEDMKK
jgi:flagellar biosynthetic protein FlhB